MSLTDMAGETAILRPDDDNFAKLWRKRVRIAFGQCDPARIVFTPRFYEIMNAAIEDWYREALGLDYYDFIGVRETGLGYVAIDTVFVTPCMMGDEIDVFIEVRALGNTSFTLGAYIFRGSSKVLEARMVTVVTDLATHRAKAIPADLREALESYRDNNPLGDHSRA